jgi:hypothetical protein
MLIVLIVTAVVAAARGLWSPCGLSMLSSLNPVSERSRGHRFWVTACWYVFGAVSGGALFGGTCALGAFGVGHLALTGHTRWALALAAALVAALSDARLGGWSLPTHPRQVDDRWLLRYRRWIYASGYGVQIGAGFATYIMTAGVYLVAALAVLTARPVEALTGGLLFGLARGLAIVVVGIARDPGRLRRLMARVDAWADTSAVVAGAACAAVAAVAAGQLVGGADAPARAVAVALAVATALLVPLLHSSAMSDAFRRQRRGVPRH